MNIEEEQTPLQNKLDTIANQIGKPRNYAGLSAFLLMALMR